MSDKNASDKKSEAKADAKPEGAEGAPKKKGGLKFALITVALLAIEGGVLFAVFSMGGPKDAQATHAEEAAKPADPGDDSCEVPVYSGALYNNHTGINYAFKVDVVVTTKAKHRDAMTKKIEDSKNALKAEIAGLWRKADSNDLSDPLYEALRRRIEAALMERLNPKDGDTKDADPPKITSAVVNSTPPVRAER
jgi:hypothetical protein